MRLGTACARVITGMALVALFVMLVASAFSIRHAHSQKLKLTPMINWTCSGDRCPVVTITSPKANIVIQQNDGIVRNGDGRDLSELPLTEQVAKLCAALEGVAHIKFTKCGGLP